jgi:hypothetical protein
VTGNRRLFDAERIKQADHVADEMQKGILLDRFRPIRATIAAHVGRDGMKARGGERRELMAPRILGLRKAVAQENGRPLAELGEVQTNAVRFDRPMTDIRRHALPLVSISFPPPATRRQRKPAVTVPRPASCSNPQPFKHAR